ncbi:MAG: hypothetical protein ACXVZV_12640 [Terriglobales bacterium]
MADTPKVPPVTPINQPKKKAEEPLDPAHVPMSEEFDRAKWTLPPIGIVLIGLAIVAVVGALLVYTNRAKPVVAGGINSVASVQLPDNTVMTAVQLNISNATPKQWFIQNIKATVKTEQGEWSDDAATATDSQRYFQAFPALGNAGTQVLKFDQKLAPGQQESGTVVFTFPITMDQFDKRKSLTITIQPFDNLPVAFTK